jgi:hypothetical protein
MKLKFLPLALAALSSLSALASPVTLSNAGFEASWSSVASVGTDYRGVTFYYQPSGTNIGWSFGTGTGLAGSYSDLAAYDGSRFAFLQNSGGLLSQQFNLASNSLATLNFELSLRQYYNSGEQVSVLIDGLQVKLLNANTASWQLESLSLGLLQAGQHTLAFQGINVVGGDSAAFIDGISLSANAVPEPAGLALVLTALGLLGATRRRQAR